MMPGAMDAVAFVRRMQDAANAHDASRMGEFYAGDATAVSPVFGQVQGRAAVVRSFETLFETFPDSVFELSDVFMDGNRLAFLGTVTATDNSGWFGLPATGTVVSYRMTVVCTLANGKIVRDERLYDMTGVVERLEKARMDRELQTAAEVQSALLPRTESAGPYWEAVADSIPCRAIGGDFFEFARLPSEKIAVALGDVEGKGTPAALVGAVLHGMFAAEVETGAGPAATLRAMNRQLLTRHPAEGTAVSRHKGSRFATVAYGVLAEDGRLVYSNAGHNPPALLTRNGVRRLTVGGPALGVFPDAVFEQAEVRLAAGDTLLMFSDGVTEATNASDEEFGEARLMACATEKPGRSPVEILDRILDSVRVFVGRTPQSDDITVAIARFRGA
jgi:phosphoserine phosphatase RsbU/P